MYQTRNSIDIYQLDSTHSSSSMIIKIRYNNTFTIFTVYIELFQSLEVLFELKC